MATLILDNYDSFTYNLVHLIKQVDDDFKVVRNDKLSLEDVNQFDNILISPGPGLPEDAGILMQILEHYHESKKILGICLGLQGIVQFFGGKLYNLESVRHGIEVIHKVNGEHLFFKGIPKNHTVGLYHSWAVSKHQFPEELMITSNSEEDIIMSIQHKKLPIFGVQYHPESVMSEYGLKLIQNWLEI